LFKYLARFNLAVDSSGSSTVYFKQTAVTYSRGLVNYWPFDGNLVDFVGQGDLTPDQNAAYIADRNGQLKSAASSVKGYEAPDGVYFSGADLTITAWINIRQFNDWARILDFANKDASNNLYNQFILAYMKSNNPTPIVSYFTKSKYNFLQATNVTLTLKQWYHVSASVQGTLATIYINGSSPVSFTGFPVPENVTRTSCFVGKSNGNDYPSSMYLDELKIFNRALTQEEIISDMNS
jgi:hypothetical protein